MKGKSKKQWIILRMWLIIILIGISTLSLFYLVYNNYKKSNNKEIILVNEQKFNNNEKYDYIVKDALEIFTGEARDYRLFLAEYNTLGDYLNYGLNKDILFNFSSLGYDENNIPQVEYNGKYEYNPVTLAQYSLSLYGQYLMGKDNKDEIVKVVDKLVSLQDKRGAFLYDFSWRYYLNDEDYEPGWVSGMAQGQALSILARVYKLTGDKKYLIAGKKALDYLLKPIEAGGVMTTLGSLSESLDENIFFEEYISDMPNYTLNGYMFTLLGLYDWSNVDSNDESVKLSGEYFDKGIKSLTKVLKYYDIGGFSAYDLSYLVMNEREPHVSASYHSVHIYQLNALYSITKDSTLNKYYKLWRSYVE